jgi:hypothetical protein
MIVDEPLTTEQRFELAGREISRLTAEIIDTERRIGALQAPHTVHENDVSRREVLERRRLELLRKRSSLLPEYANLKALAGLASYQFEVNDDS